MTWIVIDTETQGLNAQKFLMGCLVHQDGTAEHFSHKKAMYARILELIAKTAKRGGRLLIYGHNLSYDYIAIGAHHDKQNVPFSTMPFIVDHYDNTMEKPIAKWSCTLGLWPRSLAHLGDALGEPKGHTPQWLKDGKTDPTFQENAEAHQYMEQDCRVLHHFLTKLKAQLAQLGIRPRVLLTSGQIAMSYFRHHLRNHEPEESRSMIDGRVIRHGPFCKDIDFGELWETSYSDDIREAYRGGRNETFQTGHFPAMNYADVNSLYPFIASQLPFPRLRNVTRLEEPTLEEYHKKLTTLSVWRVILTLDTDLELGYLPIRYKDTTVYPSQKGTVMVGTWTGLELLKAKALGYRVHHISWGLLWRAATYSPFATIFPYLYIQRLQSTGFEKLFYKMLMNSLIGKFAQRRRAKEYRFIDQEELPEYTTQGWQPLSAHGRRLFLERHGAYDYKKTYAPILTTLINAAARDHMYDLYTRIPREHLVYTDTDSILWTPYSKTDEFKYGEGFGALKLVHQRTPAHLYAPKAYRIGDEIRVNRVPRQNVTPASFEAGALRYTDILPITAGEDAGKPVPRIRHLTYAEPVTYGQLLIDNDIEPTPREFAALKKETLWQDSNKS